MINSFKNPAIMRILRTTERHGAGWREQNFIPDNEAVGLKKFESLPCLQEFLHDYDTEKLDCMPTCAKRMPICVEVGRMPPKSHICKYFTVASE